MIRLDTEGGGVRLGGHHLDALLRGLGSPFAADPAELDADAGVALDRAWVELVAANVVDPAGRPTAAVAGWCEALVAPWLVAQVQVIGPVGSEAHQVWTGPDRGVAAAHVGDGWYDLIPIAAAGIPATLVRLARLGPRLHPAHAVIGVPNEVLTGLIDEDGPSGQDGLAAVLERTWPAVATQVRDENWRIVQIETAWAPELFAGMEQADAAGRALMVLDTIEGYLTIVPGEATEVQSITPTDLWEILIGMTLPPADLDLPTPAEPVTA